MPDWESALKPRYMLKLELPVLTMAYFWVFSFDVIHVFPVVFD